MLCNGIEIVLRAAQNNNNNRKFAPASPGTIGKVSIIN